VFSHDGKTLATGEPEGKVLYWNAATRSKVAEIGTGHQYGVNVLGFGANDTILATTSGDTTVRLWEVASGMQLGTSFPTVKGDTSTNSVAFSPDGATLTTADQVSTRHGFCNSSHNALHLWDVPDHRQIAQIDDFAVIYGAAYSPDSKTLAIVGAKSNLAETSCGSEPAQYTSVLVLWDIATGAPVGKPLTTGTYQQGVRDQRVQLSRVAFSPDGKTLATGSFDGSLRLWDLATRQQTGDTLSGHTQAIRCLAFSGDGKMLASGGFDHTVRLWDATAARQIGAPLTSHTKDINSVAFSPDSSTLVTASEDQTVRLWSIKTGA
jgi:WD40 repeat protein